MEALNQFGYGSNRIRRSYTSDVCSCYYIFLSDEDLLYLRLKFKDVIICETNQK